MVALAEQSLGLEESSPVLQHLLHLVQFEALGVTVPGAKVEESKAVDYEDYVDDYCFRCNCFAGGCYLCWENGTGFHDDWPTCLIQMTKVVADCDLVDKTIRSH